MEPNLEFREIPGFQMYMASSDGRIWSKFRVTPKELRQQKHPGGYLCVTLYEGEKRKFRRVSRLVLEAFKGQCPTGCECGHVDGNPLNNSIANLKWCTHQENIDDKKSHGTHQIGERHNQATLTNSDVLEIRRKRKEGVSVDELAAEYKQKPQNIRSIIYRDSWRHI